MGEITIEMGCCKFPETSALKGLWEDHRAPLLAFMKRVHMGVKGNVRRGDGSPIAGAVIQVRVREIPNVRQHTILTTAEGDSFRLLLPGCYLITARSGNLSRSAEVNVVEGAPTIVDFVFNSKLPATRRLRRLPAGTVCGKKPKNEKIVIENDVNEAIVSKDVNEAIISDSPKHRRRSDNLAAAGVIVTIGVVVCVLAGVVLYRKVNEIRNVEKSGGYTKIDSQG